MNAHKWLVSLYPPAVNQLSRVVAIRRRHGICQFDIGRIQVAGPGRYQPQILLDRVDVPVLHDLRQEGRHILKVIAKTLRNAGQMRDQGAPPVIRAHDDGAGVADAAQAPRCLYSQSPGAERGGRAARKAREGQGQHTIDLVVIRQHVGGPLAAERVNAQAGPAALERLNRRRRQQDIAQVIGPNNQQAFAVGVPRRDRHPRDTRQHPIPQPLLEAGLPQLARPPPVAYDQLAPIHWSGSRKRAGDSASVRASRNARRRLLALAFPAHRAAHRHPAS